MSYLLVSDSLVRGRALHNFLLDQGLAISHIARPSDDLPEEPFDTVIVQFNYSGADNKMEELLTAELKMVTGKLDPTIPILVTLPAVLLGDPELTILLANKCIQFGASDYMVLPDRGGFFSEELLVRLRICTEKAKFSKKHESLKKESKALEYGAIVSICALAECRDQETGKHILRVSRLARLLAENIPQPYRAEADYWPNFPELMERAAPLHDIGKVAISDHILLNKNKLGPIQYLKMQQHTVLGAEFLSMSQHYLPTPTIEMGIHVARSHHERFDGGGYPHKLKGRDIPLPARVVSIADVYDSIRNKRCYRPCAMPHEQAAKVIRGGQGRAFDPDLVDVFFMVEDKVLDLYKDAKADECVYGTPIKDCRECQYYINRHKRLEKNPWPTAPLSEAVAED